MNTMTEYNRKLAETLRSFSLEPSLPTIEPPVQKHRRLVFSGVMLTLGIGAIALVVLWSEVAPLLKTMIEPNPGTAAGKSNVSLSEKEGSRAVSTVSAAGSPRQASLPRPTSLAEITGSGFVVAPRAVTVFSKYEGQVASIRTRIGDHVETGQIVVGIEDISADFTLQQARADADAARFVLDGKILELRQASNSLRRNIALSARNAVSTQAVEEAQTARDMAENAVDQARQTYVRAQLGVSMAQERIDALIVRAPIAGTVTRLDAHVGGRILARIDSIKENESLLTITDTQSLAIDADVAETNIAALRPGLRGEAVLDGFPEKPFTIEVQQLWPVASAEKGTITLRLALVDPPAGILPNMAARIRITTNPTQRQGDISQ
ncbi:HlyD family efflux transporter periplasmic adaptor subunit [Rhizobium sp. P38BS-XIX]|uniref:efflux RND transporter periplasmic adaptor subunit n=1 Tax=Rhizobium sp. P38BS-XIX TaxID=2726740 RepID=UPI001456A618|nr:efflux RND transporter periplasmic adaptor subunit [Rhizobium sp. P38BS-XIX]NLS01683.1 HlyD family efflux transporter periplasmic adaptor subunit [Rhizobium sp. P38BS-XIX]